MVEDARQPQPKWRARRDATKFVICEDDVLAFHRPSGATHLLNHSAARIISGLAGQVADIESIMSELMTDDSGDSPVFDREDILLTLTRLEELGLIQKA